MGCFYSQLQFLTWEGARWGCSLGRIPFHTWGCMKDPWAPSLQHCLPPLTPPSALQPVPALPWEVMATGMSDSSWNQGLLSLKKAACHLLVDMSNKNSSILFYLTFWQV